MLRLVVMIHGYMQVHIAKSKKSNLPRIPYHFSGIPYQSEINQKTAKYRYDTGKYATLVMVSAAMKKFEDTE